MLVGGFIDLATRALADPHEKLMRIWPVVDIRLTKPVYNRAYSQPPGCDLKRDRPAGREDSRRPDLLDQRGTLVKLKKP